MNCSLVFILLDLPLARSFFLPLALVLRALVLATSRLLRTVIFPAALRRSLRRPGRRAPRLGALGLRWAWGTYPFLRSILTPLRLRLRLRRTSLPLHRLLVLLLLLLVQLFLLLPLSIHLLALLLFRLRRRSLLHRLLRLRPGPSGVALRLDLLLALLPLKPALGSALLKMLLCYGLARLIAVILRSNHLLLLDGARIVVARILPLVNR